MEHEVFVPVSAERLREALADPARVARAIQGLHQEAGAERVTGRLRMRIAGHTITYRGSLRVTGRADGSYAMEAEGTEARGTGTAKLSLLVRLLPAEGGVTLAFTGTAVADGRIAELPGDTVASAGARLLGRFAEDLGAEALTDPGAGDTTAPTGVEETAPRAAAASAEAAGEPADTPSAGAPGGQPEGAVPPGADGEQAAETPAAEPGDASREASGGGFEEPHEASEEPPAAPSVFDADIPPSSLDPFAEEGDDGDEGEEEYGSDHDGDRTGGLTPDGFDGRGRPAPVPSAFDGGDPQAEAAHARRTMIGRSAEEVDHAPPRGRYAPVPAPETMTATATLRWAAPAAALVLPRRAGDLRSAPDA
ncbi:SRPBCC domain-containing protein, partial [Streptomyces nodosus]